MTFKIMCFAFKVAILVSNVQRGGGGGGAGGDRLMDRPHCLSRFATQHRARLGTFEAKIAARKGT